MKTVRDLLVEADPIRNEGPWPRDVRQSTRDTVMNAPRSAGRRSAAHLVLAALVAVALVGTAGIGLIAPRSASAAAIAFEARLAEEAPAPGLTEATIAGSDRTIYLHPDTIATNADIADARVVESGDTFQVTVALTAEGAYRVFRATEAHLDRPVAILLDGEVVMAPVVRSPIKESAVIAGDFTRAEAERIADGIRGF